jgi:hypothetical protein
MKYPNMDILREEGLRKVWKWQETERGIPTPISRTTAMKTVGGKPAPAEKATGETVPLGGAGL